MDEPHKFGAERHADLLRWAADKTSNCLLSSDASTEVIVQMWMSPQLRRLRSTTHSCSGKEGHPTPSALKHPHKVQSSSRLQAVTAVQQCSLQCLYCYQRMRTCMLCTALSLICGQFVLTVSVSAPGIGHCLCGVPPLYHMARVPSPVNLCLLHKLRLTDQGCCALQNRCSAACDAACDVRQTGSQ